MTKKEEITTYAQHHYDEFASEFTSKETDGVNSLLTPSPQGDHKKHCAKLDWSVDAVAVADSRLRNYVLDRLLSIWLPTASQVYYKDSEYNMLRDFIISS